MKGLKKVASMVILRCKQRYLLLKRGKPPNQGLYLPVGGKLDPHEGPRACAIRETLEETGIQIQNPKFCGTLIETSPVDYNWMCYIYEAEIEDQPAPDCDEGSLEWIEEAALQDLPTPPTDWEIYQYVKRGQPFAFCAEYDTDMKMVEFVEEIEGRKVGDPEPNT